MKKDQDLIDNALDFGTLFDVFPLLFDTPWALLLLAMGPILPTSGPSSPNLSTVSCWVNNHESL